ncbi:hypothetical protein ElyMa_002351000 [Elysia marginata]|uniref:Uncharacterized protein n=1 Tax=Elysia marginata TaxID=1093978 RepID=A0AAV4GA56_9GAST|nr:hypothetical protein ElyMa_002351000 [Elysia marginata]
MRQAEKKIYDRSPSFIENTYLRSLNVGIEDLTASVGYHLDEFYVSQAPSSAGAYKHEATDSTINLGRAKTSGNPRIAYVVNPGTQAHTG